MANNITDKAPTAYYRWLTTQDAYRYAVWYCEDHATSVTDKFWANGDTNFVVFCETCGIELREEEVDQVVEIPTKRTVAITADDFSEKYRAEADRIQDLFMDAIHKAGRLYVETCDNFEGQRLIALELLLAIQAREKEGI